MSPTLSIIPFQVMPDRGILHLPCVLECMLTQLFGTASILWPSFIVATAAAIVASQATISMTYSIIKQALALGCFPRVRIIHTSKKYRGQIYSPDINWILLIFCIAVTAGFKNQSQIANAYGKIFPCLSLCTDFTIAISVPAQLLT